MQIRLVYTSVLKPEMTETAIAQLVEKAAAFNKLHHITGIIGIEKSRVCQILEGRADVVDALFTSIREDQRHGAVNELYRDEIHAPHFQKWGMVRWPMVDIATVAYSI